jgi:hypothetical protein
MSEIDFLSDAESAVPPDEGLTRVRDLVEEQRRLEVFIEHLESELSLAKGALEKVQEEDLPAVLQEFGLSEMKLSDGTKIVVKQEYYATIKEQHRNAAFAWLEANGHGDLIKHDVSLSFTKGQDEYAKKAMDLLADEGFSYHDKQQVHPQTLRAFVREQIEAGRELPMEEFSVHVKQIAKLNKEKK